MYQNKNNEELLLILAEVCEELRTRTIGTVEAYDDIQLVISTNGNTFTCLQLDSNLGVSVFTGLKDAHRIKLFEEGKTLQDVLNDQKSAIKGILGG